MFLPGLSTLDIAIMVVAITASGLMRGFTGGAGANFLSAPVLAVIIGPREAVPIILGLNFISAFQLVPGALPHVIWRQAVPLGLASAATVPFGAWILFTVDQDTMRRAVAATAVVFSLLMLSGWRYRGPRGAVLASAVGASAGAISGAVSMGGPPVLLYLLSGPEGSASNRATFIAFGTVLQLVAVVVFAISGAITERMMWLCLIFLIPFLVSIYAGTRLFHKANEQVFRRVTLGCMLAISLIILVV